MVLLPLKIEALVEVGIWPNIDVFVELPKGIEVGLIAGFPKVLAAEETTGVLGNCAFIVRGGFPKTGAAVVVATFPKVSVAEVVVAAVGELTTGTLMAGLPKVGFDK